MPNSKIKGSLEISVLGDEFKICRNLKYLPLTTYPSYIQTGLIVFCLTLIPQHYYKIFFLST